MALAATLLGCGGDRITDPADEAARAAAELERAASEIGPSAGPGGVLTFQTAAAALRGGAQPSEVTITVDGVAEKWRAFAHEIRYELPQGTTGVDTDLLPTVRALLVWRSTSTGLRVIHLLAGSDDAELGAPVFEPDPTEPTFPALLVYAEGRDLVWEAVRGRQKSSVVRSTTLCPARPSASSVAPPPCVEASFTFELSGVEVEPFTVPQPSPALLPPNRATGTRSLSMLAQSVAGVSVKLTIPLIRVIPIPTQPVP